MRYLVFERLAVKWDNIFSAVLFITMIQDSCRPTQDRV